MVTGFLAFIVGFIVIWIISSVSVYLTARIINVSVPFLRVLVVTLIADIVSFIIIFVTTAGSLFALNFVILIIGLVIGFIISLAIYKYLFNISWTKTFLMLIIAGVIDLGILLILLLILAAVGYLALGSAFSSLQAAP